jgi:hypothetical protein
VVEDIISALSRMRRTDEGRRAMDQQRELDPLLRIANLGDWLPIHRPEDIATFAEGLRKAGLPE